MSFPGQILQDPHNYVSMAVTYGHMERGLLCLNKHASTDIEHGKNLLLVLFIYASLVILFIEHFKEQQVTQCAYQQNTYTVHTVLTTVHNPRMQNAWDKTK